MSGRKQNDFSSDGFRRVGEAVSHLGVAMQGFRELDVYPTGLSIRAPQQQGLEFFIVIRGETLGGEKVVAFHSAFELGEALRGVWARLHNGTLRWREDQFARDG